MIAQFKPAPPIIMIGSAILLIALGSLTGWSRAGEGDRAPQITTDAEKLAIDTKLRKQRESDERRGTKLARMIEEQDRLLRQKQAVLDEQKQELGITQSYELTQAALAAGCSVCSTRVSLWVEARAEHAQVTTLYEHLSKLSRRSLEESVYTTSSDPVMTRLFEQRASLEQRLILLAENLPNDHPEAKSTKKLLEAINIQLNSRLNALLEGLKGMSESSKTKADRLTAELEKAKRIEAEVTAARRPYFQAKHEFETMRQTRDLLQKRLMEERSRRDRLFPEVILR